MNSKHSVNISDFDKFPNSTHNIFDTKKNIKHPT